MGDNLEVSVNSCEVGGVRFVAHESQTCRGCAAYHDSEDMSKLCRSLPLCSSQRTDGRSIIWLREQ